MDPKALWRWRKYSIVCTLIGAGLCVALLIGTVVLIAGGAFLYLQFDILLPQRGPEPLALLLVSAPIFAAGLGIAFLAPLVQRRLATAWKMKCDDCGQLFLWRHYEYFVTHGRCRRCVERERADTIVPEITSPPAADSN